MYTRFLFLSDMIKMYVKSLGVDFVSKVCFFFGGLCHSHKKMCFLDHSGHVYSDSKYILRVSAGYCFFSNSETQDPRFES